MTDSRQVSGLSFEAPAELGRLQVVAAVVGILGGAAAAFGYVSDPEQFFKSYLIGFLLWLSIPLGCLGLLMIHHLTGGSWGVVIRRVLEAATRTLPLMALLFLPLLGGFGTLYEWSHPEEVAHDPLLQHKAIYLNVDAFIARAGLYFVIWIGLAWLLNRMSARQDREPSAGLILRMQRWAAPGLILYGLAASFASYDWLMSLEPHWYSTMYGVYFMGTHGLSALAFLVLIGVFLAAHEPMSRVLAPRHFHDWGKLIMAFVMLWAYFCISQFLIIWSANLPHEIAWYLHRFGEGWITVAAALLVFHFFVPFLLLLSRDVKRNPKVLAGVALFILLMRWVDLWWQVMPTFFPDGIHLSWQGPATMAAVGGLWLAFFVWQLQRRPILPPNDPFLEEAMGDGH